MSYHYARRPQQNFSATPREETPATLPCRPYPQVYDLLGESSRGADREAWLEAREAATNLCGTCQRLQPEVADPCLGAAIDRGERWAFVVTGRNLRDVPSAVRREAVA